MNARDAIALSFLHTRLSYTLSVSSQRCCVPIPCWLDALKWAVSVSWWHRFGISIFVRPVCAKDRPRNAPLMLARDSSNDIGNIVESGTDWQNFKWNFYSICYVSTSLRIKLCRRVQRLALWCFANKLKLLPNLSCLWLCAFAWFSPNSKVSAYNNIVPCLFIICRWQQQVVQQSYVTTEVVSNSSRSR